MSTTEPSVESASNLPARGLPVRRTQTGAQAGKVADYLQALKADFCFFYQEVARLVGLDPPGRARLDIAHWMQHGPKRRGVLAMRKIGKTPIACAYNLWLLFRNPNEQILHSSASARLAEDSVLLERKWIDVVAFLRHLKPRPRSVSKDRDNISRFDVGSADTELLHSPSVTAIGITGQLPGTGASHVNPDDVETGENTLTRPARALLLKRAEEFEHLAFAEASILYIGTPHHEESLYRELEKRGYVFRAWPLIYPEPGEVVPNLAPMLKEDLEAGRAKPGDPVFPEVFPRELCLGRRMGMSSAGWAMQCMMRTDLLDTETYPLKLSDLVVLDLNRDLAPATLTWGQSKPREDIPSLGFGTDRFYGAIQVDDKWLPYQGCKGYIDPAGSGNDEMAWAVVSQLHGYLYVKYIGGVKGGATQENLQKIVLSLREHDARDLYIERNFGGEMLISLIEPVIRKHTLLRDEVTPNPQFPKGWSCAVDPKGVHSTGQKEIRILESLEPVFRSHRLVFSSEVAKDRELCYQITRLNRTRGALEHDDRVEALAGAVKQWRLWLDQDAELMTKNRTEREQTERVRRFVRRIAPEPVRRWGGWTF